MDTHTLPAQDAALSTAPAAAAAPYRARLYGGWNWIGLQTLIYREVRRFIKVAGQTITAPIIQTALFMTVFAFAIPGRHWADTTLPYVNGLAPGLIMMTLQSNAFQNSSSSMIGAKLQGISVDFLMPPLSAAELTIAFITGAAVRGFVVGLASLIAVGLFANVVPINPWISLYFAFCAAVIFGAIGLMGGIWAEKFDSLSAVTNFVIMPLTFLSGTFFSTAGMPGPFSFILTWNPVFYLMDGFRSGFIGVAHTDLAFGAALSGALALALSIGAWALLRSGYGLKA